MAGLSIANSSLSKAATYIVSPRYDWLLFLSPPLLAMAFGYLISGNWLDPYVFEFSGNQLLPQYFFINAFIHAHLVIVFFRSHGNPDIYQQFPVRFILVPGLLLFAMLQSNWVLIGASVLITFWDVYHSALQTFGFARIYDAKCGNDPLKGRRLDWWLNLLLYAGPILAGATMMEHFGDFAAFDELGAAFFVAIPAYMEGHKQYLTWAVVSLGGCFLVYYVFAQVQLHRDGYKVSPQKVYLLVTTGIVSLWAWGFNTWGEAFFIMNFFHAVQYFGIVWAREQGNILRIFKVASLRYGKQIGLVLFLSTAFAYGIWVETVETDMTTLWAITMVVSLMHFWYDSFIWSVRKKDV